MRHQSESNHSHSTNMQRKSEPPILPTSASAVLWQQPHRHCLRMTDKVVSEAPCLAAMQHAVESTPAVMPPAAGSIPAVMQPATDSTLANPQAASKLPQIPTQLLCLDQNQNLLHSLDRTAWLSFMSQAPNTAAGKHHAIVLLLKQQQRISLQPRLLLQYLGCKVGDASGDFVSRAFHGCCKVLRYCIAPDAVLAQDIGDYFEALFTARGSYHPLLSSKTA